MGGKDKTINSFHKVQRPKRKDVPNDVDNNNDDWITNLARQQTTLSNSTKQERIQKRQAKKQRRETLVVRQQTTQREDAINRNKNTRTTTPSVSAVLSSRRDDKDESGAAAQRTTAAADETTKTTTAGSSRTVAKNNPAARRGDSKNTTLLLLRSLAQRVQECVETKNQHPISTAAPGDEEAGTSSNSSNHPAPKKRWSKPYSATLADPSQVSKKKKKRPLASVLQPRRSDYGGIGLARDSLYIDLNDPSCQPRLQQEFQEHVPGFFGKQRTKAMKKQLDGQMLWRQLLQQKQQEQQQQMNSTTSKKKKKKSKSLSAEERVEGMIKSGEFMNK